MYSPLPVPDSQHKGIDFREGRADGCLLVETLWLGSKKDRAIHGLGLQRQYIADEVGGLLGRGCGGLGGCRQLLCRNGGVNPCRGYKYMNINKIYVIY